MVRSIREMLLIVAVAAVLSYHARLYQWYQAGTPGGKSPQWVRQIVSMASRRPTTIYANCSNSFGAKVIPGDRGSGPIPTNRTTNTKPASNWSDEG